MSRAMQQHEPGSSLDKLSKDRAAGQVPEGYEATSSNLHLVPLMAWGAARRYHGRTLTEAQWGTLLRRMRFAPERIAPTMARLSTRYTAPLGFDEWCALFEHLALEHVLATKHQHLR